VLRLALRELIARRTATVLAGLGLLTATLGFIVLASTSRTAAATLQGDIRGAWPAPYDLLIRPTGARTPLEIKEGLVRPNFLSGVNGGITITQLRTIRQIPGVQVAAPIAVVGFVQWPVSLTLDLRPFIQPRQLAFFRVRATATGDTGMSRYPLPMPFMAATSDGREIFDPANTYTIPGTPTRGAVSILETGNQRFACDARVAPIRCYAPTFCNVPRPCVPVTTMPGYPPAYPFFVVLFSEPVVIAGVDPVAEAALVGLDRCLTAGRYLNPSDRLSFGAAGFRPGLDMPVLVSSRSFIDEQLSVQLDQSTDIGAIVAGTPLSSITGWQTVLKQTTTAGDLYQSTLPLVRDSPGQVRFWSAGDVSYQQIGRDRLRALARQPDSSIYTDLFGLSPAQVAHAQDDLVPAEARDTWLREMRLHGQPVATGYVPLWGWSWNVTGQYDPRCLPGFSDLSGERLENYTVPAVRLPNGRELGPTRSMAGYLNTPPTVLTTMDAASFLANPQAFTGTPERGQFISAVRVRVVGTENPGPAAEARLARVAAEIHDQTALQVDIVRGSSSRQMLVDLPAGEFGRPALTVTEGWSVKGVAVCFLKAVAAQNLALFALVLVGAIVLVGQTSYTTVRRRRREFGMLRALGWPAWRIAWLVEFEMWLLGICVGAVVLGIDLVLTRLLRLEPLLWVTLIALPLAVVVAGVAAIIPAISAARGSTVAVLRGRGRARPSHVPPSVTILALRELMSTWGPEALLGAGAVALGAALMGAVVLIAIAFRGQLDTTLLGTYLAARIHPFHLVLAALTLAIGALAAGQVITLSYLERQPQLAVLRALGWPRSDIAWLIGMQALALGIVGGLAAALMTVVLGLVVGATAGPVVLACGLALAVAAAGATLAGVGPMVHAFRATPARALRGE